MLKAVGAYFRESQRAVGNRDFALKDTHKILHTPTLIVEAII